MQAYANVLPLALMRRQAQELQKPLTSFEKRFFALSLTMCASEISQDAAASIKAGRNAEALKCLEEAEAFINCSIAFQLETILASA